MYVVWDLDGVVLFGHKNFQENMFKNYSVDKSSFIDVYFKSSQMQKYKAGIIGKTVFWDYALNEWNLENKASAQDLINLMIQSYELNNQAINWIDQTRLQGHKAIICTNNFSERFQGVNKKFDLISHFDGVFLSYEKGILKPDLVDLIPDELSISRSDLVLLDDSKEIVQGAIRKGYRAILCKEWNLIPSLLKDININLN